MHDYYFVRVYFKTESIRRKTTKDFPLRIVKFKGNLDGKEIDCASMDETNAIYTSSYVCEKVDDKKEPMNYIGYDTEQWIKINLNREKEYPRYHYINKSYHLPIYCLFIKEFKYLKEVIEKSS